ncbi:hypothetical protein BG011_004615 [Mortierella polycephala]|uniref:Glucosidase 2 subunit beta n=1 Tax=Mortierella polycephala TaxID=41804 RepID=A0A9P6Q031_9FUNG|nr:hypothetical protein BG011_004615 [Mortierella polycephala]
MKTYPACLPLLATLALSIAVAKAQTNDRNSLRGVSPSNAKLYVPNASNHWTCLNGSKTIPFSAINDDYCDCADGSDEPGHIATDIKSSRVNDGVCDPECCDGSDEFDGRIHCPNVCDEVGVEARKEQERVRRIQEEGSRLRKGYIQHGKTTKLKLQQELEILKAKTDQVKAAAVDAKENLDKITEEYEAFLESSKKDREAEREAQLQPFIQEQIKRLNRAKETKGHLHRTLQDLRENHNKNYHDMAVKEMVSEYDDYVTSLGDSHTVFELLTPTDGSHQSEPGNSADTLLDRLIEDTAIIQREITSLHDILMGLRHEYNTEYNDEAVLEAVKVAVEFDSQWNTERQEFNDELPLDVPEADADKVPESGAIKNESDMAQAEFDRATDEEVKVQNTIKDIERKLNIDFSLDETFAELLDQCFDFKDADKFSNWEGDNYSVQKYTGGSKCWNGPERSVRLEMTCGAKNEILSVTEPEKCEYHFKMQTPAVCPVLPDSESGNDGNGAGNVPQSVAYSEERKDEVKRHDEL